MFESTFLGIDVGTSAVKLVELSENRGRIKVENYGQVRTKAFYKEPMSFEKGSFVLSVEDISKAIAAIVREAGVKAKRANFSIPDFSTFFTSFELPPMSKDELPEAIRFEARQHVPLPMSELTLDWSVVEGQYNQTRLKLLVVAIPERVVQQYKEIASESNLKLSSLEAEAYSVARSLSGASQKKMVALLDVGAQTTTINIVDHGTLKLSHSFDVSGNDFTQNIAKSLQLDYEEAEYFKQKYGIREEGKAIRKVLLPRLDLITMELKKIMRRYQEDKEGSTSKVLLAGGTARMPGLKEYLSQELNQEVDVISPFADLYYPSILENRLEKLGPSFAVAVGLGIRGLTQ
ncbi:MAG: type IV pilus assembly protein PilM [Candidatus Paceibacterota bacterium]